MRVPKGLKLKNIRLGTGEVASKGRTVVIHYDCFLPRGEKCGSSRDKPEPAVFVIGRRHTFPGLEHGVVGMAIGGVRSVRVSPQLTYWERKVNPNLPENVALRYEIELLQVLDVEGGR